MCHHSHPPTDSCVEGLRLEVGEKLVSQILTAILILLALLDSRQVLLRTRSHWGVLDCRITALSQHFWFRCGLPFLQHHQWFCYVRVRSKAHSNFQAVWVVVGSSTWSTLKLRHGISCRAALHLVSWCVIAVVPVGSWSSHGSWQHGKRRPVTSFLRMWLSGWLVDRSSSPPACLDSKGKHEMHGPRWTPWLVDVGPYTLTFILWIRVTSPNIS